VPKKTLIIMILILAIASTITILNSVNVAVAAEPAKLKIYAGPTRVPADNNAYDCIFVQLQDSNSRPARAVEDTVISLSSSLTSVGAVDPTITISKGNTYAVAKFYATFTPGTTTIAASATGYETVQTSLVTVAPVPYKIALYGFPAVIPSDGSSYNALVVQLQDTSGNPAKAPLQGLTVTLTSADSNIVSVPETVSIIGGQTYAQADISSNAVGTAMITGQASGYASAQVTITAQQPSAGTPDRLRIYVAPPRNIADNTTHAQIAVQLLNSAGIITQQPETPIAIQLTSSNGNVGSVQSTLAIPTGNVYAVATFSTTYQAGSTTITAAASDLTSDTEAISTIGPIPSKLAVFCSPSVLPADDQASNVIEVQLQDSSGKPALDPNGDVTVSLFSSEPSVGDVPSTLTIPYGSTYATAEFKSTYLAGPTTITAQASGYSAGQADMRVYVIDQYELTVTMTADPASVVPAKQTNITAYVVDPGGNPTTGATVKFTSNSTGTFTTTKSTGNGYYTSVFTSPNATIDVVITATVSKTDYTTSNGTALVSVAPIINYGTLQICIKDDNGQPIANATVYTVSQPSSMTKLNSTTNELGYVTFDNAAEGNYTLNVNKIGYSPKNVTLSFKAGNAVKMVYLVNADNQNADLTWVWLILIPVIVVPVIASVLILRKRSLRAKFEAAAEGNQQGNS
jgi:hypothetical protein